MTLRDMNYILQQAEVMTSALENILMQLSEDTFKPEGVMYVDGTGDISFIDINDAQEVMDSFGENCVIEAMGSKDFALIYKNDEKVTYDGESYLFGDYMVMKFSESGDSIIPLTVEDMDDLEAEYASNLTPFMLGDKKLEVYQL